MNLLVGGRGIKSLSLFLVGTLLLSTLGCFENKINGKYGDTTANLIFTIESLSDGTGTAFSDVSLPTNGSMTFYAIARNINGEYLRNTEVSWQLTGGIGNLVINGDGKSATFNAGSTPGTNQVTVLVNGAVKQHVSFTIFNSAHLAFTSSPVSAASFSSLGTITIEIRDADGNLEGSATDLVTLTISTDPNGNNAAFLSSGINTLSANAVGGIATFTDVTIDEPGTGFELTASATGYNSADSGLFNVTGARKVFRSVGPGSTVPVDSSGGNLLNLTGKIATFDSALASNIGVGDVLQYDSDGGGNGSTVDAVDSVAIITYRISSTQFLVKTPGLGVPPAAVTDQDWSICRAHLSVSNAEALTENMACLDDNLGALENFDIDVNGRDIASNNEQWNVALYADGADSKFLVQDWSTSSINYFRVFAPSQANEVGVSQRHQGIWSSTKARVYDNNDYFGPVAIGNFGSSSGHVRIDGLLIENASTDAGEERHGIKQHYPIVGEFYFTNNIIRMTGDYSSTGKGILTAAAGPTTKFVVSNNIIYNFQKGIEIYSGSDEFEAIVYNNTVYNSPDDGIYVCSWAGSPIYRIKNNIVEGSGDKDFVIGTCTAGTSDYANNVSEDATAIGTSAQISVTASYFDKGSNDFRLKSTDTIAKGQGLDLTSEPNFAVATDIAGQSRSATFDVGAHAYVDYSTLTLWNEVGSGTSENPYGLFSKAQLLDLGLNGCGNSNATACTSEFRLYENIDMDDDGTQLPIGDSGNNFQGTIDGNGHTIEDFTMNRPGTSHQGLIGSGGAGCGVSDLNILDANITGGNYIGTVAGTNCSLNNVHVLSGSVTSSAGAIYAGGLVARNNGGSINNSSSNVTVTNYNSNAGGIIAMCDACTVNSSYSLGDLYGNNNVGGVIGLQGAGGSHSSIYARGNIIGTGNNVGGLVGNFGTQASNLSNSYATGTVRGNDRVGGLIGNSASTGTINGSWASSQVFGATEVGGLVGYQSGTLIDDNFAVGRVEATGSYVGGAIGRGASAHHNRNFAAGDVISTGGGNYVGGFVGTFNWGTNDNYATGNVYTTGNDVGGYAGTLGNSWQSFATGNVFGGNNVGGFQGRALGSNEGRLSYALGNVHGNDSVGGFSGKGGFGDNRSYSRGAVSGATKVGGFVGDSSSYAGTSYDNYTTSKITGSGFAFSGLGGGTFNTSYWNSSVQSGQGSDAVNDPAGPGEAGEFEPKTSAELMDKDVPLAGFNFGSEWIQLDDHSYPIHQWSPKGVCMKNPGANEYDETGLGAGTLESPWIICNYKQLEDFGLNGCGSGNYGDCGKHLRLGQDINLEGKSLTQFGGSGNCFSGRFDGYNNTLENYRFDASVSNAGLFYCVSGIVMNLKMKNVYLKANWNKGAIAGSASGHIINSEVEGVIVNHTGSSQGSGGIVGKLGATGQVIKSQFVGSVDSGLNRAGGVVGWALEKSQIINSEAYITGMYGNQRLGGVLGDGNAQSETNGALIFQSKAIGEFTTSGTSGAFGGLLGIYGVIKQSYASMDMTVGANSVGGISGGYATVSDSYTVNSLIQSTHDVGGIGGIYSAMTRSYAVSSSLTETTDGTPSPFVDLANNYSHNKSYYDQTTSGMSSPNLNNYVNPLTTAQMYDRDNFNTWNFTNVWFGTSGGTVRRPQLRWIFHPICHANASAEYYNDIGSGSAADPYLICFKEQLMDLGANCGGGSSGSCNSDYLLMNDIDLENDTTFSPIGDATNRFIGRFDGQNHTISRLKITGASSVQGLFGKIETANAVVSNLRIVDADVAGDSTLGILAGATWHASISNVHVHGKITATGSYIGGLAGDNWGGASRIENCTANVSVTGGTSGNFIGGLLGRGSSGVIANNASFGNVIGADRETGGLIGFASVGATILNSYASGDVSLGVAATDDMAGIGGLIGRADTITLTNSYATGIVTGLGMARAGGLIGRANAITLTNSYASGAVTVTGVSLAMTGGLIGRLEDGTIEHTYATGNVSTDNGYSGGFLGYTDLGTVSTSFSTGTASGGITHPFIGTDMGATFTNNYWNETLAGTDTEVIGEYEGLSTIESQSSGNYTGWPFTNDWIIDSTGTHPKLLLFQ